MKFARPSTFVFDFLRRLYARRSLFVFDLSKRVKRLVNDHSWRKRKELDISLKTSYLSSSWRPNPQASWLSIFSVALRGLPGAAWPVVPRRPGSRRACPSWAAPPQTATPARRTGRRRPRTWSAASGNHRRRQSRAWQRSNKRSRSSRPTRGTRPPVPATTTLPRRARRGRWTLTLKFDSSSGLRPPRCARWSRCLAPREAGRRRAARASVLRRRGAWPSPRRSRRIWREVKKWQNSWIVFEEEIQTRETGSH